MSVLKWRPSSCAVCRVWTLANGPSWTSDDVLSRSDDPPAHRCVPHDSAASPKCLRRDVDSPDPSYQIIISSFYRNPVSCKFWVEPKVYHIRAIFSFFFVPKRNTFVSGQRDLQFVFSIFFIFLFSNIWSQQTFEFHSLFEFSLSCMLHSLFKYMSVFENVHRFWILKM